MEGDLNKAKHHLGMALSFAPKNTNAIIKLADVLFEAKDFEGMMQKVNQAIDMDKEDPTGFYHRGEFYAMTGNYDSATQDYTKAIRLKKDFIKAYLQKARALVLGEKFVEVEKFISEAVVAFPENAKLVNSLGEVMMFKGDLEKGLLYFNEALKISPSTLTPYLNIAVINTSELKDYDKAIECLSRCIEQDPKFESAYFQLGSVYLLAGRNEEAFSAFEMAVKYARNKDELLAVMYAWVASRIQYELLQENTEIAAKYEQNVVKELGGPFSSQRPAN